MVCKYSMTLTQATDGDPSRIRAVHWAAFLGCLLAFLALRLSWIGHLLSYDEAFNLLTFRAYAAGGSDFYSNWFWRYPPMYSVLMLLLSPLKDGFAERAEFMVILLNAAAFLILFLLNARLLGVGIALWASFLLAVMPGAVFYDVWIKQDALVSLFGLLSIFFFFRDRPAYSGLCVGLALLSKPQAAFYVFALCLLWLLQDGSRRKFSDIALLLVVAFAASSWWYLLFGSSTTQIVEFMRGSTIQDFRAWDQPWYYYLEKLHVDVGWFGIALCLTGVIATGWMWRHRDRRRETSVAILWPVLLLMPAYFVVSVMRGKASWYTMIFYPALATVQAIGVWGLATAAAPALAAWRPFLRRSMAAAAVILIAGASLFGVADRNYEHVLRQQDYWMWWGASLSRNTALIMNRLVRDDQRALITPMYYWDTGNTRPCSIFTYYLKSISVLVRRSDNPPDGVIDDVKRQRLDWVMVSLPPGARKKALIDTMAQKCGLHPLLLEGACIFKTDSIYRRDVSPRSESRP